MNKARLRDLIQRYLAEEIRMDELRALKQQIDHDDIDQAFGELIDEAWLEADEKHTSEIPVSSDALYQGILDHPKFRADPPSGRAASRPRNWIRKSWLAGAAALLLMGVLFFWPEGQHNHDRQHQATSDSTPIVPGGNKALLTLADGRKIDLSTSHDGIVVGKEITYVDGTSVLREPIHTESGTQQLVLSTPKGGTYQLTLSDGTKVWLNSASTLTYPDHFTENERVVELQGEAYFEVTHAPGQTGSVGWPFRVMSKGQVAEVLGTTFNIAAYPDEAEVTTTLVDGAVQVVNQVSQKVNRLTPGTQSVIRGAETAISEVDVEHYTAWKNGYFAFADEHITDVMTVIARWYDIEVEYEGDMSHKYFGGTISRFEHFETLLKTIALTGAIRFKISGRRVTVMT